MQHALNSLDSIAGRADALPLAFVCSWTNCGPNAAWVRVAGELDISTVPELERALRGPQSAPVIRQGGSRR
jgi:hypothetical protein